MVRRLGKFAVRLGLVAAAIALAIRLLDDRDASGPTPAADPPAPDAPPEPWVEPDGDACPPSHPIKAKVGSKVYRTPASSGYATSRPDRCYVSEAAAQADGFRAAKR